MFNVVNLCNYLCLRKVREDGLYPISLVAAVL